MWHVPAQSVVACRDEIPGVSAATVVLGGADGIGGSIFFEISCDITFVAVLLLYVPLSKHTEDSHPPDS
jgi:hypothetical protein